MELKVFSDVDTLLAYQEAWDDLWYRSGVVSPTVRAELVALWMEHFGRNRAFSALVVVEGGRLLAGLPLVRRRIKGLVWGCDLPANPWAVHGELLLDESADTSAILGCLCQGLRNINGAVLWIDLAAVQSFRWRQLLAHAQAEGMPGLVHLRYPVGGVHISGDFSLYWETRSGNLRRKIRKCLRRLEAIGPVELRICEPTSPEQWEEALETAWRVEDASWKGQIGTSVLRCPGMREFYSRQTRLLARWGYPRLVFLEVANRTIAFAFGWESKGVLQVWKIGYDPEFSPFSPGHLLWRFWLQELMDRGKTRMVDFCGPLTEAARLWVNVRYPVGRVIIPTCWRGKMFLHGYRAYRILWTRLVNHATDAWDWASDCNLSGPEEIVLQGESVYF